MTGRLLVWVCGIGLFLAVLETIRAIASHLLSLITDHFVGVPEFLFACLPLSFEFSKAALTKGSPSPKWAKGDYNKHLSIYLSIYISICSHQIMERTTNRRVAKTSKSKF
jgi:hypothetical protein